MTEKTFSQKVARGLEILSYLLLIVAVLSLLGGVILILYVPIMFILYWLWFSIPTALVACYGIFLMMRYVKHSRGDLDEDKIASMWIGTIVYNSLLSCPFLYAVITFTQERFSPVEHFTDNSSVITYLSACLLGYALVIGFSLKAYFFDRQISKIPKMPRDFPVK